VSEQPIGPIVDDTPAERPGPVTLEGRYCRVEKLDPERHSDGLWQAFGGDESLWTYLAVGPFREETSFRLWLDERAVLLDPYHFAVVDASSGKATGIVTLMEIRPAMRVIEMGSIVYSRALQRTPAATEAQYLMARHVFDDLHYRRYEWKCNSLNAPSRRAAARLGFSFEGTFRQHMIVKGRSRDTAWFAILDGEWPAMRVAFERWLAPENFDSEGGQKASLAEIRKREAE
jgi:RimJ/RimL family protein N-acetyltransferase